MRIRKHWTPRYVWDRLLEMGYEKLHPEYPWLSRKAIFLLEQMLRPSDRGLEFGSGRSTIWFARKLKHLTSVEDNAVWHGRVVEMLREKGLRNVDYLLRPTHDGEDPYASGYVRAMEGIAPASMDFILVDGSHRSACANMAVEKIRPGGIFVVDNANWFLPSGTRAPQSRSLEQGPLDADWARFLDRVAGWRRVWCSDGVIDTAVFFASSEPARDGESR